MPTVVSSGNVMHIRFMTDSGNCNIEGNEDPGELSGYSTWSWLWSWSCPLSWLWL